MNDNFIILIGVVCVLAVGALIGTAFTQNLIYTKCLELGHTAQMCKELTK